MKKMYLTIFSALTLITANATENPTKPAEDPKPLTFSGYVDTYYQVNFNGVRSNLGASGFERIFDQNANSIQVGLAQFKTTYSTSKVDGVIDLVFGNAADLGNYGNVASPITGSTSTALAIKQAYLTWKATDKFSITAGQFGTHVGYEVIDAYVNYNYSLSNLFGNGPFYHTGVKATVAPSDKFSFTFGLANGLDTKQDNNKGKGIIGQIYLKPTEKWNVYLNYFGSNEGTDDDKSFYNIIDLTTTMAVTEKFNLGLNAAYGTQDGLGWGGVALYANTQLSEKFGLGLRYEHFDNNSAIRALLKADGTGAIVDSFTLTGNVTISENLLFKPEFRFDGYNKGKAGSEQFVDKDGKGKDSQATLGGALIFYF
jgi:hypothetical protein